MTDLYTLVTQRRSFRRFRENVPVSEAVLRDLVNLGRLCSSAMNRQPLRYVLSCTPERNALFFPHMVWGASLADWNGPTEGERPAAYIVMLGLAGSEGVAEYDAGIAAGTIMLGAAERGLGGCMLGGFDRDGLRAALNVPEEYNLLLTLALGAPGETVALEEARLGDSLSYWRDANDVHHVPKLALDDVILDLP